MSPREGGHDSSHPEKSLRWNPGDSPLMSRGLLFSAQNRFKSFAESRCRNLLPPLFQVLSRSLLELLQ